MRVLLGVPTHQYKNHYPSFLSASDFPTGFGYLASSLIEAGHDVIGFNPNNITGYATAKDMVRDKLTEAIGETEPEIIGLGGLCVNYAFLRDTIQIIRGFNSDIPIVLGGRILSADRDVFSILRPDFGVLDEGEEAMVDLVNMLSAGIKDYGNIDNIAYWKDDKPVFSKTNYDYTDINSLPFPDYEAFNMKDMIDNFSMSTRLLYRYSRPYPRPFGIVTARQCPFNCSFCQHHSGPRYRTRTVENILDEIKQMYEKYEFNILLMLDELFVVNKARMREFCEKLIEARDEYKWDFDWTFQTHANARLDDESLKLAKEAGCYLFSYGLESASPIVLKSMNKKINICQVTEAMDLARKNKVGFAANLIFGDTAETSDTISESLSFWFKHCRDTFVFLSNVSPYPGSKLFDDCVNRGLIKDKRQYYETIDDYVWNMTQIPDYIYASWLDILRNLERTWLPVRCASSVKAVEDQCNEDYSGKYNGDKMYRVYAQCPYCEESVMYRNSIKDITKGFTLGVGCTHCNRKIRINIIGS